MLAQASSVVLGQGAPTPAASPPFFLTGEPGSEAASLMSEKLLLRPSVLDVCPLRWLNLIPRRGLGILKERGRQGLRKVRGLREGAGIDGRSCPDMPFLVSS